MSWKGWQSRRLSLQGLIGINWLITALSSSAAAQTQALPDTVDHFIRAEVSRQHVPGLSVAILRGDTILLARGYGFANVKQRVAATDSTIYSVGSLTKPFTAAAVVLLSQQGRLKLDDAITKYLPEGAKVWSGVTIRHLLTHTSGVPQDTMLDYNRDYTEAELVRSAAQPLQFTPGDRESYSSTGYSLLGIIMHRVTGKPWGDFVREQIFQPLGMRTARVNSESVPNRATGYYLADDTLQTAERVSASINSMADCCLSFTVRDLAQFAIGLNHAKPLGLEGLKLSWTPVRLNHSGTYPYGLGWNILEQRGYRRIGHSGAWTGFHATFQRYPDFGLTVIVLLNLGQANSEGIATALVGLVEPRLTQPHLLPQPLTLNPPTPINRLLRALADNTESPLVTPELKATFPADRREIIASFLQAVDTWTPLGCDAVGNRAVTRLRSRIEHICYTKGSGKPGSLLFTVLYDKDWRAAGLDNVFGV
ncbi:MAG: serine hydrolase domain-containing protein [Gemmatimonadales bacterium]